MFKKLREIDTAFRHVKFFTLAIICICGLITGLTLIKSFQVVSSSQAKIFVLANDQVIQAYSSTRRDNIPVEARGHVKNFHQLFFELTPDEDLITSSINTALYLADGSAKSQYDLLRETGYYRNIVAGNVSQRLQTDSVRLDLQYDPIRFTFYGKQEIIRPTSVAIRELITQGQLRMVGRSDNNRHGFIIERWKIISNKDLSIKKR